MRMASTMFLGAIAGMAVSAALVVGAEAQSQGKLSDKSVNTLMDYAWQILPSKFTTPEGKVIEVDKSKREGNIVPVDAGRDIIWTDSNGSYKDAVSSIESGDIVHRVGSFANGADRTLNGDRIADPTAKSGHSYRTFSGNQLFSSSGPRASDIRQGSLGDCWVLAGFGAIGVIRL